MHVGCYLRVKRHLTFMHKPHDKAPHCELTLCVVETRHLDRLRQLLEFEQESDADSEQESNTDSHSTRSKAQVA